MGFRTLFNFFSLCIAGFVFWGCAGLFSDRVETDTGFRKMASARTHGRPLPVEIAMDIANISENGTLFLEEEIVGAQESEILNSVKKHEPAKAPRITETVATIEPPKEDIPMGPLQQASLSDNSGPLNFSKLKRTIAHSNHKTLKYRVKRGDTLMEIAFEKYGDVYRWREIYTINRHNIAHYKKLQVGTLLTIQNVEYVYIEKNGLPYLIRKHDTLSKISQKIYGTFQKWRHLWHNNKKLIKDPNRIYSGFTLYYRPANKPITTRAPSGQVQ